MRRRLLALLGLGFILAAMFILAGRLEDNAKKDRLTYALARFPATLDPTAVTDESGAAVLLNLYEGLVRFEPGGTGIEPALARDWNVSPDARTWTFFLQEDTTFADGTLLDAAAVKDAVERQLNPETAGPYASFIYEPVTRVETKGRHMVIFHLKHPYAPFLGNLAMLPAAVVRPSPDQGLPIGTGPFVPAAIESARITIKANAAYREGPPQMKEVLFVAIPDADERWRALAQGRVDVAEDTGAALPAGGPDSLVIAQVAGLDLSYLAFYTNKKPFDNPNVRRAASLAINQQAIVDHLFPDRAVPAAGPLPPGTLGHHPTLDRDAYNLDEARRLLDKEGYNGEEITLITYQDRRPYNPAGGEKLARLLAEQLAQAGFKVRVEAYPWEICKLAIHRQEGHAFVFGWVGDNGDPDNFLYTLLASAQIQAGNNASRYSNPHVDMLLGRAQQVTDAALRERLYRQAQELIAADAPWVFLNHRLETAAHHPTVKNLVVQPTGGAYLARVRKDDP
jgi:peptide/nickel transport system substrate-binding protein